MNTIQKIFKTTRPLIGMVHLLPINLESVSMEEVIYCALKDAIILKKSGMDSIIIENNYDLPHTIKIDSQTKERFLKAASEVSKKIKIPIGISVLWNDYYAALEIALASNGSFIRVPVFVDVVQTSYGIVRGDALDVIKLREKLEAQKIAILTDIQVKHSTLLNIRPLKESAREAIQKGSDGLIITGKWTGDAPNIDDLASVRNNFSKFPILIGSGATKENTSKLLKYADGIIVGTAIKSGIVFDKSEHVNLKPASARIDALKAEKFVKNFARCIV